MLITVIYLPNNYSKESHQNNYYHDNTAKSKIKKFVSCQQRKSCIFLIIIVKNKMLLLSCEHFRHNNLI